MEEVWKDIPHYEGKYQVSSHGRVRNISTGLVRRLQHNKKDGYVYVSLSGGDKRIWYVKVHRLVCMAFLENTEGKRYVDHIDGNKLNNHLPNLRWVTFQENISAAWDMGLYENRGSKHGMSLLNDDQVRIIKNRLLNKEKVVDIVVDFPSVKKAAIYDIKQGRTWAHI